MPSMFSAHATDGFSASLKAMTPCRISSRLGSDILAVSSPTRATTPTQCGSLAASCSTCASLFAEMEKPGEGRPWDFAWKQFYMSH